MAKQASIEQDGTITEALSNAMFRVELREWARNYGSYFWEDAHALH